MTPSPTRSARRRSWSACSWRAVPLLADVKPLRGHRGPRIGVLISSGGWNNADSAAVHRGAGPSHRDRPRPPGAVGLAESGSGATVRLAAGGVRRGPHIAGRHLPPELPSSSTSCCASPHSRAGGPAWRAARSSPCLAPIRSPFRTPRRSTRSSRRRNQGKGSGESWFWLAVGGMAAVAAVGAVLILLRARRTTSRPRHGEPSGGQRQPRRRQRRSRRRRRRPRRRRE